MPRKARQKRSTAIYHIMCRSISEILLFRDNEDKDYYLHLLKRYIEKFKCSLYAYCLMDNHVHLHIDPKGYDISKYMHCVNTSYVRYYNKKYERHGHVFQGRFGSRILDTTRYNLIVSAYIHNNPFDIKEFKGNEENYEYSSYGIYLGIREDKIKIVDLSFIMNLFDTKNKRKFAEKYFQFASKQRELVNIKDLNEKFIIEDKNEYISGREVIIRNFEPLKVISFISEKLSITVKHAISVSHKKDFYQFRAFTAYVLKVLCGMNYHEICKKFFNITISGCSYLCNKGYELLKSQDSRFTVIFDELILIG